MPTGRERKLEQRLLDIQIPLIFSTFCPSIQRDRIVNNIGNFMNCRRYSTMRPAGISRQGRSSLALSNSESWASDAPNASALLYSTIPIPSASICTAVRIAATFGRPLSASMLLKSQKMTGRSRFFSACICLVGLSLPLLCEVTEVVESLLEDEVGQK
jgi:hypothetical protein